MKESRRKPKNCVSACSSRDGEHASRDGNWQRNFQEIEVQPRRDGGIASRDGDPSDGIFGQFRNFTNFKDENWFK